MHKHKTTSKQMAQIAFSLKYDLWVTHWECKKYTFWEGYLAILFTF